MTPDALAPFRATLDQGQTRRPAAAGRRAVGYLCTYTPIELIHAAGFLPVRIMGQGGPITAADALVPEFLCPWLRRALDRALRGDYDFLAGLIQGYSCDAACGVTGIWGETFPDKFVLSLPLPYNDGPAGRRFFKSSAQHLIEKLDKGGGNFTDEKLAASIDLYAQIRRLILDLDLARRQGRSGLTASQWWTVVTAFFVTPPEDYALWLADLAGTGSPGPQSDGTRVLVSGGPLETDEVLRSIEAAGGRVAADDLCSGVRGFDPPDGRGDSPLDRLVDRYSFRRPCPARARAEDRLPILLADLDSSGSRAVIFVIQKFCTPHLADLPTLTRGLRDAGYPSLVLELEETGPGRGQVGTRLQAFFEMLG
jgi:benzoyl-CoA reductase/2-hydroxyglutaryl-CoA dehydratase subunit BcrC/BadD/HgdB